MSRHTPAPWRCLADNSLLDEPHFQVVGPAPGAALFDSINRSPLADEATEQADMQLAAAAPLMFSALLVAREFISTERNSWLYCNTQIDGALDPDCQPVLDDIDQLLLQVDSAMTAASEMGAVTAAAGSGQTPEQQMREFMDHEFSRQSGNPTEWDGTPRVAEFITKNTERATVVQGGSA